MFQRISVIFLLAWVAISASEATGAEFKRLNPHSQTRVERIEKFVAADVFVEGKRIGGRQLTAIGLNFKEHFLGVVEQDVPEATLIGWTLLYTSEDKSLIGELGGEQKAPLSFLGHCYRLMDLAQNGPSHVDWQSNFAYLRSPIDHRLWAIHWSMNYENEWSIGAVLVPHPHIGWRPGSRLFGPTNSISSEPSSALLRVIAGEAE
jgi:hypothetical protein